MTDDRWGLEEAEGQPEEAQEPLSPPVRCLHCGQLHSTCRERAAELLRSRIRAEARDRLDRTESALRLMHEGDRVAVARWITNVLERPPLANSRARGLEPIAAVLDALWMDIYHLTPDPMSPTFEYGGERWTYFEPHHELAEMREGEFVEP